MKNTDIQAKRMNQDRYRQAFSGLKMEAPLSLMPERKAGIMNGIRKHAVALGAAIAVTAGSGAVYAQNIGGIRTLVTGWFHGEQKSVIAEPNEEGGYTFIDSQTGQTIGGGGGVEYDLFGNEKPLSAEELMEEGGTEIDQEDGKWVLYVKDQVYDLSSLARANAGCYFRVKNESGWQYYEMNLDENGEIQSWSSSSRPFEDTQAQDYTELTEENRIR